MIRLTNTDDGRAILVNPDSIMLVVQCMSSHPEVPCSAHIYLDLDRHPLRVSETVDEIQTLIAESKYA